MILKELLDYMENADIVRIMDADSKEQLYAGYLGIMRYNVDNLNFSEKCMGWDVKKFRIVPEIRHKRWKEKGLMPPLLPEQAPLYSFSDLQMEIYREIWIEGPEGAQEGGRKNDDGCGNDAERRSR